ncbi:TRAP transporter substrate-binding protein [Ammoniphilus sp. YIM 78166]|uniref:TRAP transporter substrate-binding protein n=1 Tax=Ammoniphilus sp. YIM 78166 TaxID=1644106 RepID=UPI00106F8B72|nr:TRAP transporter substrate-binding protein [Ammoniphilus sp. YIM 78166]
MKKFVSFLLSGILMAGTLAACSSSNQTTTPSASEQKNEPAATDAKQPAKVLKIGSVNNDKHTLFQGYSKFKEIVEAKSNGSIKVEIYHSGVLGDDRSMIEGLQLGTLEAVGVSTSMLGNWSKPMLAYDLPFAFPSEEVADKVLDGPYGQKAGQELEKQGLILVSYMENGFRHLTNNKREVKSVADVAGLKIRTMQTPLHLSTWKALGANPTPMAYTELFTAMQQGVVDGQENPYGNMALDKFYEVQKYLTKTGHVYNPMGFVLSKKFMDQLSEEERNMIKEAGIEASKHQRQLNRDRNQEYLKTLTDSGMAITELTPESYQEFLDKVQVVYQENVKEIGQESVDEFIAEVNKNK